MKRLITILILALTTQVFSQTYGIFSENPIYNIDGNLFECDTCGAGIAIDNGFEQWWITGADSSYFGEEGIHIIFDGLPGQNRVRFTAQPDVVTDDIFRTLNFSEWNDGDLAFNIKLIDTVDVQIAVRSFRNGSEPGDESDEPLSKWGLDIYNTETWQKIYVDPTNLEGNNHDMAGFSQFALRSREQASNFLADEIYMVYGLKTYGLYADSSEFKMDGSFGPENILLVDGATVETVPGMFGDAMHVTFAGGSNDEVVFGDTAITSFSKWNDQLANLVFYIKLNQPLDVSIEYAAARNGGNIGASDERLSSHGLDVNNTEDWQRIVLDLREGMEGDMFDYNQFKAFRLRSRGNASDFLVDEVHVRYPENTTVDVDENNPIQNSFSLMQNYPNPFNPSTSIEFNITKTGQTSLRVYNILGQQVAELVNQQLSAGAHKVNFDASTLSSGIYFYKLESGNHMLIKKMILMK